MINLKYLYYLILTIINIFECVGEDTVDGDKEIKISVAGSMDNNLADEDINEADKNSMESKVVGGHNTVIEKFPHAVCLLVTECSRVWFCGGSVLTQRMLLTAAHCVFKTCERIHNIDAVAGSTSIEKARILKPVKRLAIHEDFNPMKAGYDIALLMLTSDLSLGRSIRRVIIRPVFPNKAFGYVAAWGDTCEGKQFAERLKYVKQVVWDPPRCNQIENMPNGTICASSGNQYHYPHRGDAGSGLVTTNYQLIGLISSRRNVLLELIVYTNVSFYYSWIKAKTYRLFCAEKLRR